MLMHEKTCVIPIFILNKPLGYFHNCKTENNNPQRINVTSLGAYHIFPERLKDSTYIKWASSRENLSSGFPTMRISNLSPQLQTQARNLEFRP